MRLKNPLTLYATGSAYRVLMENLNIIPRHYIWE
jgi:hypothetical protein